MNYSVELLSAAKRQLAKLPEFARKQIAEVIDLLETDPRPHGYKKLKGKLKGLYRIDTGNYRIIYEVQDRELVILIIKVGDRKDVYK